MQTSLKPPAPASRRDRHPDVVVASDHTHPPKARLAFRVGIVGHRPNRLPVDDGGLRRIRQRLDTVLAAVRSAMTVFQQEPDAAFYAAGQPLLRANSPLAEGSDRAFAMAALELGYALWCPMPFARSEYEKDFAPDVAHDIHSVADFRDILERAEAGAGLTTFELDGDREDAAGAYGAAGRLVLNQSDLLVVVWDGGKAGGGGGTVDTLNEAITFHVPVLWIDAANPERWSVLRKPGDLEGLNVDDASRSPWSSADPEVDRNLLTETVASIVLAELRLPAALAAERGVSEAHVCARRYFAETRPPINGFLQWKYFRDLVGLGRFRWLPLRVPPFVDQIRRGWPGGPEDCGPGEAPPSPAMARANLDLREHYAWADKCADLYADAHRSTSVLTSLLAATAVFLALLPMAAGWTDGGLILERITILVELLVLVTIVGLGSVSQWRQWHPRWLEYRVLAELVRQLRLLLPLGGGWPTPRAPAHLITYGDPTRSWMTWQLRAIARSVQIPDISVTPAYIEECLEDLYQLADGHRQGQLAFHEQNHKRSHSVHERLHTLTAVLFSTTIVAVILHFGLTFVPGGGEAAGRWLLVASAVAPAFGAALANINNQGEFARIAKRSMSMAEGFRNLVARVTTLRARLDSGAQRPTIAEVTVVARAMSEMMVDENADWRVVVLDLPHAGG